METRSRKRAQASEQRPSPTRAKKKPNISSPSLSPVASASASAHTRHRYPIRRAGHHTTSRNHNTDKKNMAPSTATAATATVMPPTIVSTRLGKNRSTSELPIKETNVEAHQNTSQRHQKALQSIPELDKEAHRHTTTRQGREKEGKYVDKGKEKEKQAEAIDKGKEKEKESHRDAANLQNSHLNNKINKTQDDTFHRIIKGAYNARSNGILMQILSNLASGDEVWQLDGLTQLCELLSMGTEDSLAHFPTCSFVAELVGFLNPNRLNPQYNPELILLAARALTHLCDALPSSCSLLVNQGAIPYFCGFLLSIQYIDLAEQSLQALAKISREHPAPCLRAGALTAVLSNFEFYSTGVQRVAVSTAANMCRHMPSDASDFVTEAVPILTNLLQYTDAKVVEHASVCLTRIAESFASSSEKLDMLCSHGLVPEAARLISVDSIRADTVSQTSLSNSTYTGLVRLLSICAGGSAVAAETLLHMNISGILKDILAGSGQTSSKSVSPLAMNMPREQLREIVNLINDLLPSIPHYLVPTSYVMFPQSAKLRGSNVVAHKQPLCDQPNLLIQFGADLFPVLVQVYGTSVNPAIRYTCLDAIHKLVHFSTADMLRPIFQELNISSFLAGVLASKDPIIQITALQIADLLMHKLRDYFAKMFVKEGVLHAINSQFHLDLDNSLSSQRGTVVKSPLADRSRRTSRRGSSASNKDMVSEAVKEASFSPDGPLIKSGIAAAPLEESRNDLRSLAISTAKMFKDAYFPMNSGNAMTENLKKLKKLCSKLSGGTKSKGKNVAAPLTSDQIMAQAVTEILTELGRGDGLSTFEFVGCGIVEALLNYFSCGNLSKERLSHAKLRQKALKRLHQFFAIARSCNNESAEPLLTMIVKKLQSALASLERFPVNLTHLPSGTGKAGRAAGLSALAQPLKLQISRVQTERGLRDFPSTVVLVSPLTTLSSVEEFLWPRVRRSDVSLTPPPLPTSAPAAVDRRPLTRSNLSAPVASERPVDTGTDEASKPKGKGKVGSQNPIEEQRGPETRNTAARRRNAAAASVTLNQSEAPTGIEDEEAELSFVQGEDTYATDEDDYYSDEDIDEHGQVPLIFEEERTLCDGVYEVWLGDDMDAGQGTSETGERSVKRATTGSTSACGKGASEVVVPGASSLSSPTRLCFSLGGKPLDMSWTILKAIQHQTVVCEEDEERFTVPHHESRRLWDEVHILNYQQADSVMEMGCTHPSGSSLSPTEPGNKPDIISQQTSLLDSVLHKRLPCDMDESSPTYNILLLLYILDGLNRLAPLLHAQENLDAFAEGKVGHERTVLGPLVPQEEFLSSKLIPKMVCQMQDAMALCSGNLPTWCHQLTRACPFLFPFETKRQYFYLTALGLPRAFHRLQQQQIADNITSSNNREPRVGRLRRRKVRILRDRIFDSATKVMEIFSADKGVLEVEYFDEVGTGLGPTLEFYTLLSHELQKVSLGMWRSSSITERMDDDNMVDDVQDSGSSRPSSGPEDFVYAPYGLFPQPWKPNSENYAMVISYFRLLGQVMGKALQDGRLLDLPLSTPFYKLMLEQELDLYDIRSIDLELGSTLEEMQNLVRKKKYLKSLKPSAKESRQGLGFHNARVEDLCLEFTLPGYPGYPLKPGGENIMVDMENLEEYITLIVDATVKTGIAPQMEAFRAGFNQIFPISALQIFNEEELSYMLCGHREMWLPDTLVEHMRFDHGYNASSPPIRNLLEIMGEFSPEQQRAFLQFVTGSPQLPCGGLSALRPKLTIVRKHPSGASGGTSPGTYATLVDGDLPSVMTCANYLKLPPYSCKEVMWERLLYAIHEGQGSFDLS